MSRIRLLLPITVSLTMLIMSTSSLSQTARPGGADSSALALQQLQQLASERTALQAENARIKADLEQARKERDALRATQDALARRSRGTEAELVRAQGDAARLEGDLARERQRVEELVTRFRETATEMRQLEVDRAQKTQRLAERERFVAMCVEHNRNLHQLGLEVIDKLEDQDFLSVLARREPFTQIKRVQLENLADAYRGTAEENLLPPEAAAP